MHDMRNPFAAHQAAEDAWAKENTPTPEQIQERAEREKVAHASMLFWNIGTDAFRALTHFNDCESFTEEWAEAARLCADLRRLSVKLTQRVRSKGGA